MEAPAFRTMIAQCIGAVQRSRTLAAIELTHMPAAERHPDDAIAIDVCTAYAEVRRRHIIFLDQCRLWRVVTRIEAIDRARDAGVRTPD